MKSFSCSNIDQSKAGGALLLAPTQTLKTLHSTLLTDTQRSGFSPLGEVADSRGLGCRFQGKSGRALADAATSHHLRNEVSFQVSGKSESSTASRFHSRTSEHTGHAMMNGSEQPLAAHHVRRPSASEQTLRRKELHGHRGDLRRALAVLFHHHHRARSAGSVNPQWSLAVQPGTVHDPREAELVIEPVGCRLDKRTLNSPNTTIIGKGGNRYILLNSLSSRQEKLLSDLLESCEPEVEEFVEGRLKVVLGQGAFGSVRLAMNERTQQLVVVKKMLPECGLEEVKKFKMLENLPEEARRTIINMEDYAMVPGKNGRLKAYLFEELMNHGDLGDYENAAVLDLPSTPIERLDLAMHILELVQNIHEHHTYHRDLKPDNLLRTDAGEIKLGDVGFMSQELYPSDVGGTLPFMPPEAGQPHARADLADAFAIGVMFYQLLGREHPAVDYPPPIPPVNKAQPMDNYHLAKNMAFNKDCSAACNGNSAGKATLASVAYHLMHPDPAERLTVAAAKDLITQLYRDEQRTTNAIGAFAPQA